MHDESKCAACIQLQKEGRPSYWNCRAEKALLEMRDRVAADEARKGKPK